MDNDINQIAEEIKKIYAVVDAAISLVDGINGAHVSADTVEKLVKTVNTLRKVED